MNRKIKTRVISFENFEKRELMATDLSVHMESSPAAVFGSPIAGTFQGVLDSKVAYEVTTIGNLSFNLSTGGYSASVELPGGLKLDTSALKTLLTGQLAIPKIDPIEAAANLVGLKSNVTSNYDEVQNGLFKQYGGGNVYVSTQRFTDWASPENAAVTIGSSVASLGTTSGQVIQEAKDVIIGELGNLYTWLKNKAPLEAEAAIASALKGIVTGKEMDSSFISVKFINVDQTYTVGLGGPASRIAGGLGDGISKSVTATHKGFAIVWKGSGDSLASLTNSMNKFDGASMSNKSDFTALIGRLANRSELTGLGEVMDAVLSSNPSAMIEHEVATKLASTLGLTQSQVRQLYETSNPIIDLRMTQLDEQLNELLGNLAAGNEGSSKVTKLDFDLNTHEISIQVTIHHLHTWGSVSDILNAVGKAAGKWADKMGNVVAQRTDAVGNQIRDIWYKTGNRISETWANSGDYIQDTWDAAGNQVRTTWYKAGNTLEESWNTAGDYTKQTWEKSGKSIKNTWFKAGNRLEEAWNTSGDYSKQTWEKAGNSVRTTWKRAGNVLEEAWNTSGDYSEQTWDKAGNSVRTTWKKAGNTLEESWNTAGDYTKQTWEKSGKSIKNTWFKAGNRLEEAWNTSGDYSKQTWDKAGNSVRNTWFKAGNRLEEAWNTSGDYSKQTWDKAGNSVRTTWYKKGNVVRESWVKGGNTMKETWDATGKYAADTWNKSGKWIGSTGSKAVNEVKKWFSF